MNFFKVFIDDSGSKEYKSPYSREFIKSPPAYRKYIDFWRANYFVLCAVKIHNSNLDRINSRINMIKEKFFGTKDVELKSERLRYPDSQKKHYLDKFSISKDNLKNMTDELYDYISSEWEKIRVLSVVFDKRYYGEDKRKEAEGNPLIKCAQVILERLQYSGDMHKVFFDQFESHLKVAKGAHKKILGIKTGDIKMERDFVKDFSCIHSIDFKESKRENFIQIADLCAYNVYRQFTEFGRVWQGEEHGEMKLYDYFARIKNNFICDKSTKKVPGYGIILIPDVGKLKWDLPYK